MKKRHLLVGHSHVEAIRAALTPDEAEWFHVVNLTTDPILDDKSPEAGQKLIDRFGRVDVLCFIISGNFHNVLSLINHPEPFWLGAGPKNGRFIPVSTMRRVVEENLNSNLVITKSLLEKFPAEIKIMIDAPPPLEDTEHIMKHPGYFTDKVHLGFSPEYLRLTIYALQCEVTRRQAEDLGVAWIPAPDASKNEKGLLLNTYFTHDPTHGNAAYGRLVLNAIAARQGEKL